MNLLKSLLCRWKGHVWGRAYDTLTPVGTPVDVVREKCCTRCNATRYVKPRKRKEAQS